ncbi:MAG TPA: peptide deformylase [Candidatus Paceibacterota bacterium]|jgi:peptide deformylase|nr:peptide deformylase [Candidatus Paceibacterota bacterium]
MITIVQKEDPILRKKAPPVPKSMFGSAELKKILRDMKAAIASQDDAVAIAAPQIGVSLRIFVVSGRVLDMINAADDATDNDGSAKNDDAEPVKKSDDVVFINPEIVKLSRTKKDMEEGCLSVRYLYGKVSRAAKATVRAFDEKGKAFQMGGSGLLAQAFQHETDHLDGVLFIDSAVDLEDLPPEEIETA